MEHAQWKNYRGHLIIRTRSGLLFRRYEVWKAGEMIAAFRDPLKAEKHIDGTLG